MVGCDDHVSLVIVVELVTYHYVFAILISILS